MSTTRLPELPAPDGFAMGYGADVFSRPRMHAYGLAVWKAAMEAAAQAVRDAGPKEGPLKLVSEGFASAVLALHPPELAGSPQERRE